MRSLILALAIALLLITCSGGSKDPAPTPAATSAARQLGREIGDTYLLMLDDTKAMLALNLPADQLKPALRALTEDYRVRFANLRCLREGMAEDERSQVGQAAEDSLSASDGQDTSWLTQAKTRYATDPDIPSLLADIEGLRAYAFLDELARLHPGETVQCNR
jgi:hypothetical protein